MSENGRQKAANYDWPIIARQVLDVYEEIIQRKAENRVYAE
jgi:glycosyltransferase involved in cell wall biosynthesis